MCNRKNLLLESEMVMVIVIIVAIDHIVKFVYNKDI